MIDELFNLQTQNGLQGRLVEAEVSQVPEGELPLVPPESAVRNYDARWAAIQT